MQTLPRCPSPQVLVTLLGGTVAEARRGGEAGRQDPGSGWSLQPFCSSLAKYLGVSGTEIEDQKRSEPKDVPRGDSGRSTPDHAAQILLGVVLPLLGRGRSLVPILMCGELSGELWDYLLGPLPVDHCSGRPRGGGFRAQP